MSYSFESAYNFAVFAFPFFSLLILVETFFVYKKNKDLDFWFYFEEMVVSSSSGLSFIIKTVVGLQIVFFTYPYLLEKMSVFTIQQVEWWHIIFLVLLIDLMGYCRHRLEHEINVFWNLHRIHHTGEIFNLTTALRQSVSEVFVYGFIFTIPIAFLGFPVKTYLLVSFIHFIAQFWYHTEAIGRLGFLEKIIVTPTNHKIHHAMNAEYIDKNYSQIFIFWDVLFGTYQDTIKGVDPVVGDTRPSRSYNFIVLSFHHFYRMLLDAFRTTNYLDKLRIWFMPTGWRPTDIIEKNPILAVKNPELYVNKFLYNPLNSNNLRLWNLFKYGSIFNVAYLFLFFMKEISQISPVILNISNVYLVGTLLFIAFNALTMFMDRNKWSWAFELPQFLIGVYAVLGYILNENIKSGLVLAALTVVLLYLTVSMLVTIYYCNIFSKENNTDEFYLNPDISYKV